MNKLIQLKNRIKRALKSEKGEAYIDTAVKILIAIVLGGLLLAGLGAIFNQVIMPETEGWIEGIFNSATAGNNTGGTGYTPTP